MAGFKYEPHLDNAVWAGRYFDGTSPVPHLIQARPKNGGLLICDADTGDLLRHIAGECLELINYTEDERRIDLAVTSEDGVRISFEGISVRTQMARHIPHIGGHIPETGALSGLKIVSFLVVFMAIAGVLVWQFQRILPSLLPDSYVHTMGESTVEFIHKVIGETCTVPEGNLALDTMATKVKGQTGFPYDISVEVVDTPMVNALAAPGGRIVIFRGLIDKAESPEEVAGVLGHEMGHVLKKHSLKRLSQTMGMDLIIALLGGSNLGNMSQQLILMSFSRDAEHEADLTAIELLHDAGISTSGVAAFFGRISRNQQSQSQGRLSNFIASHPPSPERARLYREASLESAPVLDDNAWQALRSICKKPETSQEAQKEDDQP